MAMETRGLPSVAETDDGHLSVVHPGQMAIAGLQNSAERLLAVSLYGIWEWMKPNARSVDDRYAVPSVHRAISDLTRLLFQRPSDTVVVAGDLNIWRDEGTWRARYQTMFDRFDAEGFAFAGPFGADGRSTVPTYAHRGHPPRHQTDFVFVKGATASCTVLDDWMPSDHAPILIDVH